MERHKERKPNKMLRMAMVLFYMVIVSAWMMAGLYAKYTSSASGSDNARVANWDVSATGGKPALSIDCSTSDLDDEYTLTVTNSSEVTVKYDLKISLSEKLPNGFVVKLDNSKAAAVSADGKELTILNAGQLAAENGTANHTLTFIANAENVDEDFSCNFEVTVDITQMD